MGNLIDKKEAESVVKQVCKNYIDEGVRDAVDISAEIILTLGKLTQTVRCSQCQHYRPLEFHCDLLDRPMRTIDFCSFGENKNEVH